MTVSAFHMTVSVFQNSQDQYKVLGISTSHFSQDDLDLLSNSTVGMIRKNEYGVFIKFYDTYQENNEMFMVCGISEPAKRLIRRIIDSGFGGVEIDCDATIYVHLTTFDW